MVREWLIKIREEKGLSQGKVAALAGMSQPAYWEIEKGQTNPKPRTAKKIGAVLEFPWTRFFEDAAEDGKSDNDVAFEE